MTSLERQFQAAPDWLKRHKLRNYQRINRSAQRAAPQRPVGKRLPLSGSESPYNWAPWGKSLIHNVNCYAYAMGSRVKYHNKSVPGNHAGLPPFFSNFKTCKGLAGRVVGDNPKKVYKARACEKCRPGFYKVMMFVAPKNDYMNSTGDFHFYKQHGVVHYQVKRGDTFESIAAFFKVPVSRVRAARTRVDDNKFRRVLVQGRPKLRVGTTIQIRANCFSHKQGWATGPLLYDADGKAILDPRKANRNYGYKYTKYCSSFCVKNKGIDLKPKVTKYML
jgi:hypothetical protein